MSDADWLPELLALETFGNDLDEYYEAAYGCFCDDFVANRPTLLGKPVMPGRPGESGARETFEHFTTSDTPWGRKLDPMRCQRVRYPLALIQAVPSDRVRAWREPHRKGHRLHITLPDFCYLVVLHERPKLYILVTAYPVFGEHKRKSLAKKCASMRRVC
jgi:hypothetical protein